MADLFDDQEVSFPETLTDGDGCNPLQDTSCDDDAQNLNVLGTGVEPDDELADWINSIEPADPTPEAEARRLGEERANIPQWSEASKKAIDARMKALLARMPDEDRPAVWQSFEDAFTAARIRKIAMAAVDAEYIS